MRSYAFFIVCVVFVHSAYAQKIKKTAGASYFPPANNWQQKTATELGLKIAAIDSAIAFAIANESKNPRSMEADQAAGFGKEPFGEAIGPFADRGEPTGVLIYKGYLVASWGEPLRCDMIHSITKSFLSTVVGVAVDSGLIKNVTDTVAGYMPAIEVYGQKQTLTPFTSAHNRTITWNDLLRQTSDWEGTLWGKPEWADRPDSSAADWKTRPRRTSGTVYEYNDVR